MEDTLPKSGNSVDARKERSRENQKRKAVRSLGRLLNRTKHWVIISSGELPSSVYTDPGVLQALKKTHDNSVRILILVGPTRDKVTISKLPFLWNQILVLEKEPELEFAVADGLHVRYKGAHSLYAGTGGNCLAFNAPNSALRLLGEATTYIAKNSKTVSQLIKDGVTFD